MPRKPKVVKPLRSAGVFWVYQDDLGEFRWRLVAPNGKIIADSGESYKERNKAKKAIERTINFAVMARIEDL